MLYKKNTAPLTEKLFKNPTCEYRATPFWAWNCELNRDLLEREIDYMKDMGFGGFHMHVRVGMSTKYLSDDFMDFIGGCVKKAKKNDMLAWLYDEDKWPSGFAGGYVTKKKENRQKYLLFTHKGYGAGAEEMDDSSAKASRAENGVLIARYSVETDENGCLKSYRLLEDSEECDDAWYTYLETKSESAWFNLQTYADTLSKSTIEDFIAITHERYKECIGEEFGETVPAIFTDEPQVTSKTMFGKACGDTDAILPYTSNFADTYKAMYGADFLETLPELFWEKPNNEVSVARYRYHDHIAERFAEAFADTIGSWCEKNNIMLTGHMMNECNLDSQNRSVGDCMRSYRGFQLPGIDMLCDARELNTAKQAQSAVHQYGREGVLSEIYGVTGWDYKFSGHKVQGDWEAVLGVTVRVPHLYWVSMHGEAKRDYPASIGHQSPWYREYKYIEDHFARVNTAMTRGKPIVRVGVIHPIESYWLRFGPREQTAEARSEMDDCFGEIAEWLLYGLIDYDYICEGNLQRQANGTRVGEMQYDAIVVPNCLTLRSTTLAFLKSFAENGGKVVFAGSLPEYIDALPSSAAKSFANESTVVGWSRTQLLGALEENREIDIRNNSGERSGNLMYQLREDGGCRWLFFANIRLNDEYYKCSLTDYTVRIKGEYAPERWNTLDGTAERLCAEYRYGDTFIDLSLYCHDSVLLKLTPGKSEEKPTEKKSFEIVGELPARVAAELEEPNVCLLDMAEYSLNSGEWRGKEEILRICDALKEELHFDNAIARGTQPWCFTEEEDSQTVALRFTVNSAVEVESVSLALEDVEKCAVTFNGSAVEMKTDGYYVDESISIVPLGKLCKGCNEIVLTRSFGKVSTLEACYLLGDFGVKVSGREILITEPVRELSFGDWTTQGLAFYGGNVTYKCTLKNLNGLSVAVPHCAQPVCAVAVDGIRIGTVAISPYTVSFPDVGEGEHEVAITAFGNRFNTFGSLHNVNYVNRWYGPNAWRTKGFEWSYEYALRPAGITVAPLLIKEK